MLHGQPNINISLFVVFILNHSYFEQFLEEELWV